MTVPSSRAARARSASSGSPPGPSATPKGLALEGNLVRKARRPRSTVSGSPTRRAVAGSFRPPEHHRHRCLFYANVSPPPAPALAGEDGQAPVAGRNPVEGDVVGLAALFARDGEDQGAAAKDEVQPGAQQPNDPRVHQAVGGILAGPGVFVRLDHFGAPFPDPAFPIRQAALTRGASPLPPYARASAPRASLPRPASP